MPSKWRASLLIVGFVLGACTSELSRSEAEADIEGRLKDSADLVLEEVAPATSVQIVEILQPSDARRIVRFQFVKGSQESEIFEANYVRSDSGWSMTDFDSGAVDLATSIRVAALVARSADLIVALDHLGAAVREWRSDQRPAEPDPSETAEEWLERYIELKWPTRAELETYVQKRDLNRLQERADFSSVRWGASSENEMFWVEDAKSSERACVWARDASNAMDRFHWVIGDVPQCRVEGVWFKAPLGGNDEVKRSVGRGEIWLQ